MFSTMRNIGALKQVKLWAFATGILCIGILLAPAKDSLVWQQEKNKVAAEITSWDLAELLENIASVTGWQIYLEPNTKHSVSTKFKDRTPGDALRLLLGDLSFALLPEKNGPSRLYVFRTTMQEATQLVKAPQKAAAKLAKPISDELIVTVKPGTDIEALAKKLGAKVIGKLDGLNTYRLKFDDAESASDAKLQLKSDSSVDSIDYNYSIPHPEQPDMLSASSLAPIKLTPKAVPDANRVVVGLIDTSVQPKGTGIEGFFLNPISVSGDSTPNSEQPTHGTSMSETVLRGMLAGMDGETASRVRILPVDVYGNNATTSTFDVALGVLKAINGGAMIINMSLGGYGESGYLQQVIQSGHDQGVLFFASAGNDPVPNPTYPAAYPQVVAVTAGDRRGNIAPYANYGNFVDVIAPGSSIVNFYDRSWLVTGTSASSAYVAGLAAGLSDRSGKSLSQIETAIRNNYSFRPAR
jgi:Subtilase family